MSQAGYAEGLVVVQRSGHEGTGKRKKKIIMWTLHVDDCAVLDRGNGRSVGGARVMPAPATPYPNTSDCKYCQPRGEHRRSLPQQQPDGTWQATCRCGAVGTSSTMEGARNKLARLHEPALPATRPPGVEHRINCIEQPDGSFLAKCRCGESATGPSRIAARRKVDRLHRKLVAQTMLDATSDTTGELTDT